jgi:hypothetical protein
LRRCDDMFKDDRSYFLSVLALLWVRLMRVRQSSSTDEEVAEGWHPLLPAEKKLIVYSLILAAILLVVLIWASYTFFRVGH